ncbi:MAG: DUF6308 family protein, partial [Yaniella sp.]|nr:DUF6308 family protein [Yaniella sp.]
MSLKNGAKDKLDRYTSRTSGYAFNTYDHQGDVDLPLTPADVLMANLLSLRLSGRDVIPLFAEGDGPAQRLRVALDDALVALRDVAPFESHGALTILEESVEKLTAADAATKSVKQWTEVTVSKVLHRRRPHIVPVIDSKVRKFYGIGIRQPMNVRQALWEDLGENEGWIRELAATKTTPDGRPLSLLRAADILIWMSYA